MLEIKNEQTQICILLTVDLRPICAQSAAPAAAWLGILEFDAEAVGFEDVCSALVGVFFWFLLLAAFLHLELLVSATLASETLAFLWHIKNKVKLKVSTLTIWRITPDFLPHLLRRVSLSPKSSPAFSFGPAMEFLKTLGSTETSGWFSSAFKLTSETLQRDKKCACVWGWGIRNETKHPKLPWMESRYEPRLLSRCTCCGTIREVLGSTRSHFPCWGDRDLRQGEDEKGLIWIWRHLLWQYWEGARHNSVKKKQKKNHKTKNRKEKANLKQNDKSGRKSLIDLLWDRSGSLWIASDLDVLCWD